MYAERKRDGSSRLNRGRRILWPSTHPSVHPGQLTGEAYFFANTFSSISMEDWRADVSSRLCVDGRLFCYQDSVLQCCVTFPLDVPPRSYSSTFHRVWRLSSVSPLMWMSSDTWSRLSEWSVRMVKSARRGSLYIFEDVFFYFLINYFCLWSISTVKIVESALMLWDCCILFNVNLRTRGKKEEMSYFEMDCLHTVDFIEITRLCQLTAALILFVVWCHCYKSTRSTRMKVFFFCQCTQLSVLSSWTAQLYTLHGCQIH